MRIRLTDAQAELLADHPEFTPTNGTLEIGDDQLPQLVAHVEAASATFDAQPYTPDIARTKFAAKYLARKLQKLATGDQPQPERRSNLTATDLQPGDMVHLINDPAQVFKIIGTNRDGSMSVFGGDGSYRMFRDFHPHRLEKHTGRV